MPLINNAKISTFAGGAPKLVAVPANISQPTQVDQAQYGGVIRHVVGIAPVICGVATDIQPTDDLVIIEWPPFTVTGKRYRVYEAPMVGRGNWAKYRAVVGERVMS